MSNDRIYRLIKLAIRLMGFLPRSVLMFLAHCLAMIWYFIDKRHRNMVMENVSLAFPGKFSQSDLKRFTRKNFKHTASIIFEVIWSYGLPDEKLFKLLKVENLHLAYEALEKKRGLLVVSCHMGVFELVLPAVASVDIRLHILYRKMDFEPLERLVLELRQRMGTTMVPLRGASDKIAQVLAGNGIVATLLDQNVDWYKGVFADFFGRPACTNNGLAKLAMRANPVILPAFIRKEGKKHVLTILPEIPVQNTGDTIKDIENNTQAYVSAIESMVRQYPDQYFWVHNRWKTKPYCLLSDRPSQETS